MIMISYFSNFIVAEEDIQSLPEVDQNTASENGVRSRAKGKKN